MLMSYYNMKKVNIYLKNIKCKHKNKIFVLIFYVNFENIFWTVFFDKDNLLNKFNYNSTLFKIWNITI